MLELRRQLGDRFEHFQSLDSFAKSSYVLGSEAWEEYSSVLLTLIKDFVLSVWEERLYGEHAKQACIDLQILFILQIFIFQLLLQPFDTTPYVFDVAAVMCTTAHA